MVKIYGPLKAGLLVPKPFIGYARPKALRFYNWPKNVHEGGKPVGEEFEVEIPWDLHHQRLVAKGIIDFVENRPRAPITPEAPKPKKKTVRKTKKTEV
jgi:hypothetical protein